MDKIVNFITLLNFIDGNVIGFSVYVDDDGTTGRLVGTFALSSALDKEERGVVGRQLADLIDNNNLVGGDVS